MAEVTLLYGAAFSLITGAVYHLVGSRVGRKDLTGDDRLAMIHFKMWWHGVGGLSIAGALFTIAAYYGYASLAAYEAFLDGVLLIIFVALWGIGYYLAYLFTGSRRWLLPIAVFYGAFFVFLEYLVAVADPTAVEIGKWDVQVKYANEGALDSPWFRYFGLLLLLPQIIGAIGYGTLYFQTTVRRARYRIAMVSITLLAWFGSSIVASVVGISTTEWWSLTSRVISLVAALVILMAFRPPHWIQERLDRQVAVVVPPAA